MTASSHGYGRYTHGCRCEVCRQAKSDYMRDRRAAARRRAQTVRALNDELPPHRRSFMPIPGITHGKAGYEEQGCRCVECVGARSEADALTQFRRRQRARMIE